MNVFKGRSGWSRKVQGCRSLHLFLFFHVFFAQGKAVTSAGMAIMRLLIGSRGGLVQRRRVEHNFDSLLFNRYLSYNLR